MASVALQISWIGEYDSERILKSANICERLKVMNEFLVDGIASSWRVRHYAACALLCLHRLLAMGGILFAGCPWERERDSECVCAMIYEKFVSVISYKLLVGISRNVWRWCSLGQRWTGYMLSLKGRRSRSQWDKVRFLGEVVSIDGSHWRPSV